MLRKQNIAKEQDIKLFMSNSKQIVQKKGMPFSYHNKNETLKIVQQK